MKEATGELSMTTITIIAIIAIATIVAFLAPMVSDYINKSWTNLSTTNVGVSYVEVIEEEINL